MPTDPRRPGYERLDPDVVITLTKAIQKTAKEVDHSPVEMVYACSQMIGLILAMTLPENMHEKAIDDVGGVIRDTVEASAPFIEMLASLPEPSGTTQ